MTPCTATHGELTCCRLNLGAHLWTQPHPMPHMDSSGQQWDEHGVRVARGNSPYRSER